MIDWRGLFVHALWLTGLAVVLATASFASYQASATGRRLRQTIVQPGLQRTLLLGMGLACLGWLLGEGPWWARLAWGLLAAFFVARAAWLWRREARARGHGRPAPGRVARGRAWRTGWALILAGLLVMAAWAGLTGLQVARHTRSLQAHLHSLESLAQGSAERAPAGGLGAAGAHIAGMRHDLEAIQGRIGWLLPLGRILRYAPRHGGDLVAAADLLDLAAGVAAAGDRVFRSLAPALEAGAAAEVSPGERLLPAVAAAEPALRLARAELAAAGEVRARIDARRLSPPIASRLQQLDRTLPWLTAAVDGLLLAPQVLGAGGPQTYLILAQNNQELRPSGGFISAAGELTVVGGRVSSLTFRDSYAVDNWEVPHDLAPPDLQATLAGELWLFRDANWQADFPAAARRAMEIYARDVGVAAEGVVALDLAAVVSLVEALGPLEVEGIDGPVTGQNVVETVQASWQSPPESPNLPETEWFQARKDSFGLIAAAAMERLLAGREVEPLRLALALKQALEEKHVLAYLEELRAAEVLHRMGWDGALPDPSAPGDFLRVADTNVGFNKVDARVERSIGYQVDLTAISRPQVRLTLRYRNHSLQRLPFCVQEARYGETYADMLDRCYWDYVRVYVPAGSRLLQAPDLAPPAGSLLARQGGGAADRKLENRVVEGEWTAWTAFFELAPGEERTLMFEYQLPGSVLEFSRGQMAYRLQVQKQPGTEAVPFCLEVLPPAGYALAEWTPAGLLLPGPACTDLRTDRSFEAVYRRTYGR
jgi:hypothetical protein